MVQSISNQLFPQFILNVRFNDLNIKAGHSIEGYMSAVKRHSRYSKNSTPENVVSVVSLVDELDSKMNMLYSLTSDMFPKQHSVNQKMVRAFSLLKQLKNESHSLDTAEPSIPSNSELMPDQS